MFTVIFAVARTIGWISQWNEMIRILTIKSVVRASCIAEQVKRDYPTKGKR
jgi:citrate synthase